MSDFCVVLVRPRDPNNIGACARAMSNFGLSDLRVVEPYAPVWRECVSAVGADDILKDARLCASLDEALYDTCFSLAATALRNRVIEQEIIPLPSLNERLNGMPSGLTALVFGNEKTGLSNEDIERCSAVLNIPTVSKQPSINLAQAVILTCYELSKRDGFKPLQSGHKAKDFPTDAQKEIFISCLDELFVKADFRTDFTSAQRKALLRRILTQQGMDRWQLFFVKTLAERLKEKLP
jgi:tRNA/rRNA methyltransferase